MGPRAPVSNARGPTPTAGLSVGHGWHTRNTSRSSGTGTPHTPGQTNDQLSHSRAERRRCSRRREYEEPSGSAQTSTDPGYAAHKQGRADTGCTPWMPPACACQLPLRADRERDNIPIENERARLTLLRFRPMKDARARLTWIRFRPMKDDRARLTLLPPRTMKQLYGEEVRCPTRRAATIPSNQQVSTDGEEHDMKLHIEWNTQWLRCMDERKRLHGERRTGKARGRYIAREDEIYLGKNNERSRERAREIREREREGERERER